MAAPDGADTSGDSTATTTTVATTSAVTGTTGGRGSTTTGVAFLSRPDYPPGTFECDLWTGEPCDVGHKCMPYADDGGTMWNATKCVPIAPDPVPPGEPCTAEGDNPFSGVDDCEAFSICWGVNPQTGTGICVAFCTGDKANPTCADPCAECKIASSSALVLCFPHCDPLLQDCRRGQGCYPNIGQFICVHDASGPVGAAGDACDYVNVCDPGLICAAPGAVDGCEASQRCCAPFCAVGSLDPCPGLGPSTECVPYYETPLPPSQCVSGDIGICIVPE